MKPVSYQLFSKVLLKPLGRSELAPYVRWIATPIFHELLNFQTSKGSLFSLLHDGWFVSMALERYSP